MTSSRKSDGNEILGFLPRDAMLSTVYAVVVCLCDCLSHSGIVQNAKCRITQIYNATR